MVPAGKALHEFLVYDADKEKLRRAALKARFPAPLSAQPWA